MGSCSCPHEQPAATALFLLLPLNALTLAASVTTATGVVLAVSQRVSEAGEMPGVSEAESLLCSQ